MAHRSKWNIILTKKWIYCFIKWLKHWWIKAKIVVMNIYYFLMMRYFVKHVPNLYARLKNEGRLSSIYSFTSSRLTLVNLTWHFELLEIFSETLDFLNFIKLIFWFVLILAVQNNSLSFFCRLHRPIYLSHCLVQ